jgi:hypothetical protein
MKLKKCWTEPRLIDLIESAERRRSIALQEGDRRKAVNATRAARRYGMALDLVRTAPIPGAESWGAA